MIRVVVAEDQGLVLRALSALIQLNDDITVVGQARRGDDALSLVETLAPHVLVSDIEMPGLSGIDVAATLTARRSPTRVLIVTTFSRAGYLRRALDAGVRGYLLKDRPDDVLARGIRAVACGELAIDRDLRAAAWDAAPDPLTGRERTILRHAAEGRSTADIAKLLLLSSGTVRNYLSVVLQKLDADNRMQAVRIARENGWL